MTDLGAALLLASQRSDEVAQSAHEIGVALTGLASCYASADLRGVAIYTEVLAALSDTFLARTDALKGASGMVNDALSKSVGVA